jgi:hypothetical protein
MSARVIRSALAAGAVFLACFCLACNRRSAGEPQADKPQADNALEILAKEVAQEVGSVQATDARGTAGPVIVFEEFHTSRVGQLQIAIMLLRLHERHGLKIIGLEGTLKADRPLDATWFHNAGGKDARDAREDTAVRMLGEGEISSPEFMALLFPGIEVYGIEVPAEAKVGSPEGNPLVVYLVSIAEKLVTQADLRKTNELLREANVLEQDKKVEAARKKRDEAFDHLLTAHPWLRDHHTPSAKAATPTSLAVLRRQAEEIKAKAGELGLNIPDKTRQQFDQYLAFLAARDHASDTMVGHVTTLAKSSGGKPLAMVIGAAHTERVTQLLREANISFALVRPDPLHPEYGQMPFAQFERKHHLQWARTSPGTLGRLLNVPEKGKHKPPAIIETAPGKAYVNATFASIRIARAARAGTRVEDLRPQLTDLPELRIDWQSFERDGGDVLFRMWLKGTDDRTEKEVWARVGAVNSPHQARSLEEKLKQQIADLGGNRGKLPPRDPPNNTKPVKDEGPGDGKRGEVVVARTGPSELAVFAESKAVLNDVGRLSG